MSNNVYRKGRLHVMAEKCETCVFRPGNLMELQPGRLKELIEKNLQADAALTCHDTLGTRKNAICRGFFDRYKHDVAGLRLGIALDVITEQKARK